MPINGGGGSSRKKSVENNKGPVTTAFIGNIMVDTVFFHAIGDAVPRRGSGYFGKPRGPVDPKSEVVINIKTNPEIIKRITNFFLEISILIKPSILHISYKRKIRDSGYFICGR